MSVGTPSVGSSLQAMHIWGEEAMMGVFFTHYHCPHMDLRRLGHCSEYYPIFLGGALSFSHGSDRVLDLAGLTSHFHLGHIEGFSRPHRDGFGGSPSSWKKAKKVFWCGGYDKKYTTHIYEIFKQ